VAAQPGSLLGGDGGGTAAGLGCALAFCAAVQGGVTFILKPE
jgi:hypothetical protein